MAELHVKEWRAGYWIAIGGVSSMVFEDDYEVPKYFKKGAQNGEFMPKKNMKEGKTIQKKIDSLINVSIHELNMCIGFDESMFKTIGYNSTNDEYFLFTIGEDWGIEVPIDCEEIATKEYNSLVKEAKIEV